MYKKQIIRIFRMSLLQILEKIAPNTKKNNKIKLDN